MVAVEPFAVRTGEVNKAQPVLRIAERLAQRTDTVQTGPAGKTAE